MNYEEVPKIPLNSVIKFIQYKLDRHEKKSVDIVIEGILFAVITPETQLDAGLIQTYYPEAEEFDYPALSYQPFYRLVVTTGEDKRGLPIYKTIHLNKYFMIVGIQTLEFRENVIEVQPEIPSQILGFNSYEFGSKFKQ